jgi:hypothetical protein
MREATPVRGRNVPERVGSPGRAAARVTAADSNALCPGTTPSSAREVISVGVERQPVVHTVEVDTTVIGSSADSSDVDLVRVDNFRPLAEPDSMRSAERGRSQNRFRWRAVPGSGRTASRTCRAFWRGDPTRVVLARVEMAGLGSLPNSGAARAAVPGVEARLIATKPSLPGATQPAVVPFPPSTATHTSKISKAGTWRPYLAARSRFRRSRDSQTVLISDCLSLWSSLAGGRATTASRVGTRQRRARPRAGVPPGRGRPPAQPRGRYFCQPGHLHTPRVERAGGPHGRPGPCARSASGAGRERRANAALHDQVDAERDAAHARQLTRGY